MSHLLQRFSRNLRTLLDPHPGRTRRRRLVRLNAEPLEERILLSLASLPNQPLPVGTNPVALQSGPIDSDNTNDLAILNADGSLTVALNNGDNFWRSVRTVNLNIGPANGLALGLLNADPFLDLAVQGPNGITLAKGDGTGNFSVIGTLTPEAPGALAPTAGGRVQFATALLNNDTATDLVTVSPGTNEVLVFLGKGDGTFAAAQHYASGGSQPVAVVVGDFVGDSLPDLAVGHHDGTVTFFQGLPGGTFQPRPDLTVHVAGAVTGLATGSFDSSGDTEVAVSSSGGVTVLKNGHAAALSTPLSNGDFSGGLTGWTASGPVNALGGFAQLSEGGSGLLTELRQTFTVPAQPTTVSFDLVSLGLEDATPGSLPDAFEASLLDASGNAAVPAFQPGATAFFNANPRPNASSGPIFSTAAGVTFDGRHVTVDISHLTPGSQATLSFDLVGNPPGTGSTASVDNVQVNRQPPAETFTATSLALPSGAAPAAITAADVDGDGHTDLVVADPAGGQLLVYNGDGSGHFALSTVSAGSAGQGPQAVVTAPLSSTGPTSDVAYTLPSTNQVFSPLVFNNVPPTVRVLDPTPGQVRDMGVSQLTLQFSELVRDAGPSGSHSASNPASYALVNTTTTQTVPLAAAAYNAATLQVVLTPAAGSVPLPDGSYQLTVKGADATNAIVDLAGNALNGGSDTTSTFTVETAAPTVQPLGFTPNSLWPPNKKFQTVQANLTFADPVDPHPTVTLVSITSNEGNVSTEVQGAVFGTDCRTFQLQSDRAGNGNGRVYSITYLVRNAAGNGRLVAGYVVVPHDQGNRNAAWLLGTLPPPTPPGLGALETSTVSVIANHTLTLNTPTSGNLAQAGAVDVWSFAGTANQRLFFNAQSGSATALHWSLSDGNGTVLFSSNFADHDTLTLPAAGSYYLTVDGRAGATGAYQFEVFGVPATVTTSTAVGAVVSGSLTVPGQQARYTFAGTANQRVFVDVQNSAGGTLAFTVLNPDGSTLLAASSQNQGNGLVLPSTGTYSVVVGHGATLHATGGYQFEVWAEPVDVPASVTLNQPVNGALGVPGQTVSYAFHAALGQRVLFHVTADAGNVTFTLRDPSGNVVFSAASTDQALASLPASGTYTLTASATGDSTPPFGFVIQDQTAPAAPPATANNPPSGSFSTTGSSGRSVGPIDFSHLQEVTGLGRLDYHGTTYNLKTHTLDATVQLTNTTPVLLAGPVVEVFDAFAPPVARLATADGTTPTGAAVPAGLPYMAFTTELGAPGLAAGASSAAIPLQFADPTDARFGFTTTLLAPANQPPAFTSTPVTQATVGTAYSYQATASDPNGDALTYQVLVGPVGLTIGAQSGLVQWTPTPDQVGTQDVTLQVSDGRGGTATQSFTIQFPPPAPPPTNTPPVIVSTPPYTTVASGQPFSYPVRAVDPDADTLHWSLTQAPTGMTIDPSSGQLTWPSASGDSAQWANSVIAFSSQYSSDGWSAAQATGPPNTFNYGDISTSWAPRPPFSPSEFIELGYATPVHASGVTVRETFNNGFVYQIDVLDTNNMLHTVWTGTDPSQPGSPVDFTVNFPVTPYLVQGVKVYVNNNHGTSWKEIDAVQLQGAGVAPVTVLVDDGHGNFDSQSFTLTVNGGATATIQGTVFNDLNDNGVRDSTGGGGGASGPPPSNGMTLTAAGTAAGFSLTDFASNFPIFGGPPGPIGIAFPTTGGVLVSDDSGNVRLFPADADGQNAANVPPAQNYGTGRAFDMAQVGNTIYMTQRDNGTVLQLNPDGTFNQTIVSGLTSPHGIVVNPANGHLIVSTFTGNNVYDVDPVAKTASVLFHASLDGISIAPDGSVLYGAAAPQGIDHVYGYSLVAGSVGNVVFDSGFVAGDPDGTALAVGALAGKLFVNTNQGTVVEVDLQTLGQTLVATGGTRGDFVAVDPNNGTLLLTQTGNVVRLTPPSGGGFTQEPGLPNWTVYLDTNNNGRLDPGEPTAVSGANGVFTIANVAPGTYTVREVPQVGWVQTAPVGQSFTVTVSGTSPATGLLFGNHATSDPSTNRPPVFNSTPPAVAAVNNLYQYTPAVTDPDGDTLTFSLTQAPAGMAIDPVSGTIVWTPTAAQVGLQAVTIVASDGRGGVTPQSFAVSVGTTPLNEPPIFVSTPVTMALAGQPYAYTAQALDPDGDPLTYFLTAAPAGMTIDPVSGAITWSPAAANVGANPVTVRVKDGRGGFDNQTFVVTVSTAAAAEIDGASYYDRNGNGVRDTNPLGSGDGFLLVDSSNTGAVLRYDAHTGAFIDAFIPPGTAGLGNPNGLVIGPDGKLYVGSAANDHMLRFDRNSGAFLDTFATGGGSSGLSSIHGVAFGPDGNLYVSGFFSNNVVRYDANTGAPLGVFASGGGIQNATTIVFGPDGNLYEGGFSSSNVARFDGHTGAFLGDFVPSGYGGLSGTDGLAFGPDGNLYVTSRFTNSILKYDGHSGTFLGTFASGNGLGNPFGITFGPDGNLYVNNRDSNRVLRFDGHTGAFLGTFASGGGLDRPSYLLFVPPGQEPGLPGWTVYLDQNNNGQLDPGEPSTVTDANGRYFFKNLAPGTYTVREQPQTGWVQTQPASISYTLTVSAGQVGTGNDFGNRTTADAGANQPPAFTSTPPSMATVGQLLRYQATATDPDGDPITFDLVTKPAGMAVEPYTGQVVWVPTADESGPQQVVLRVTDARGLSALQSFTLTVPSVAGGTISITSAPPALATVGQAYTYAVTVAAPAGQVPNFALSSSPAGMIIDAHSGQLTWTPAAGDVGSHLVVLRVTDAEGDVGYQSYYLQVRPVSVPATVSSTPVTATTVGLPYHYQVTASDPTDGFTFSLVNGPAGMTVDPATGLVSWLPGTGDVGPHPVDVRITNDRGVVTDQTFTLTVAADTQPPSVSILQTTNLANPGDTITLQVLATDNVVVSSLTLTANGTPLTLDANGITTYKATAPGMVNLVATATDPSGNVGTGTANIRVFDPNLTTPPVALITSPAYGDTETYLTTVTGTVTSPDLEFYRLEYSPAGANQWVQFASGTQQVTNGALGTFDPTLLDDGSYDIRLTAQDIDGHITYSQIAVGVSGQVKPGNFHLEYTDLQVPLAGIPITIKRVYDTQQTNEEGDFGFGWKLSIADPNIHKTVPDNGNSFFGANPFRMGTKVYLTNPSGTREGFTFTPTAQPGLLGTIWTPQFTPDPGVYDTLTVPSTNLSQRSDGTFGLYLIGFAYNPDDFTLTTKDGTVYQYNQFSGLKTITDLNGHVITVTSSGIASSAGPSIQFVRDSLGRITQIVDPTGKVISYAYDGAGNLTSETDRASLTSTYQYLATPAHYVSAAIDPLGHQAVGATYDATGRLVGTADALGNQSGRSYDLGHNTESITDPVGNRTTLVYDALGNVVSSTDPTGATSHYTYDANNNLLSQTNPRGNTTTQTFDAHGNLTSTTDAQGHATQYAYNALNEVTTITDPLGRVVQRSYDANGNLTKVIDATGGVSLLGYDASGDMTSYTDKDGHTAQFAYGVYSALPTTVIQADGSRRTVEYNSLGLPTRIVDENGHELDFVYDADGRQLAVRDALGHEWDAVYQNDHVVKFTDPLGHSTSYQYDAAGRLVQQTDALGGVTTYTYDGDNRLLKQVDPFGLATKYTYDGDGRVLKVNVQGSPDPETLYLYDVAGNLLSVTDPNGNEIAFAYNSLNQVITETDALGGQQSFAYDAAGNLTSHTDANGHTTAYAYDGKNRLISRTDALGNVESWTYDGMDNVTSVTDANGHSTQSTYDLRNHLVAQQDAAGDVTHYAYDPVGNLISETDPNGHTTTYTYNAINFVTAETNAIGGVRHSTHDAAGNLTTTTDELGRTTQYGYDALNRLTSVTDAAAGVTQYTYNTVGQRTSETDPLNRTTQYVYNGLEQLSTAIDPAGGATQYTYDQVGNATSVTDPLGHTTQYGYDAINRLTSVTDPTGAAEHYAYDPAGNRTSTTDPLGNVTLDTYNVANRLTSATDPAGDVTRYAYDPAGNRTLAIDPLGRTTQYAYDPVNRLVAQTDPAGGVTRYAYDPAGNETAVTDPLVQTTQFSYDALNRMTQQTDPLGHAAAYQYDAVGNLTGVTDRNGRLRTFAYDGLNRQTSETWWSGSTPLATFNNTYDAGGQLTAASDPNSSYAFTYDTLGRVASVDNAGTPGVPHVVLSYGYDAAGNTTSVADNLGVTVGSTYDARNLLASRTWQGPDFSTATVTFVYNTDGQRTQVGRTVSVPGPVAMVTSAYTYDPAGRLTHLQHVGPGNTVLADYQYTYDRAGQLTAETDNGQTSTYQYDANGQLTGATHANVPGESYGYDGNGNRVNNGLVVGPDNQVKSDGTYNYTYDAEGNLTGKVAIATGVTTTFTYDYRNRLVGMTIQDSGGHTLHQEQFTYDVFDRRIAQNVDGQVTYSVYDFERAWADFNAAGQVVARYLAGAGTDELLGRVRPGEGVAWYLGDHLGSVRDLVSAGGSVLDHLDYDSFGNLLQETNATYGDRFRFTGREFDPVTGLYYYRARYYDPRLGRFLGQDSLGFAAGDANLYRYVKNNPLGATDPTGHDAILEDAFTRGFSGALIGGVLGCICGFLDGLAEGANLPGDQQLALARQRAKEGFDAGVVFGFAFGFASGLGVSARFLTFVGIAMATHWIASSTNIWQAGVRIGCTVVALLVPNPAGERPAGRPGRPGPNGGPPREPLPGRPPSPETPPGGRPPSPEPVPTEPVPRPPTEPPARPPNCFVAGTEVLLPDEPEQAAAAGGWLSENREWLDLAAALTSLVLGVAAWQLLRDKKRRPEDGVDPLTATDALFAEWEKNFPAPGQEGTRSGVLAQLLELVFGSRASEAPWSQPADDRK
jgi:RHS repeat-associated protein